MGVESSVAVIAEYEGRARPLLELLRSVSTWPPREFGSSRFQPVASRHPTNPGSATPADELHLHQKDMDNQERSQAIGVSGNLDGNFGISKSRATAARGGFQNKRWIRPSSISPAS